MKKILVAVVAVLVFTGTSMAQTDAKAKAILDAVSKKLSGYSTLKASFSIKSTSKGVEPQSGAFYIKGAKYHINISGQEIICDGKTVWTYTKATKEVQISNYNPDEQSITPSRLMGNFYDKGYTYKLVNSRPSEDVIELTPTGKKKDFTKAELNISKASTITGGTVFENNGGKYIYTISNLTPNAPAAESLFTFDAKAHPGVEVVDLR